MSSAEVDVLPEYRHGRFFLEARRVMRYLSTDLVLHWSTELSPYDFLMRCKQVKYEPQLVRRIEIIADDDLITCRDVDENNDQLKEALGDRKLVRFNFKDWTVTWLGSSGTDPAEIQAIVGDVPGAMVDMVKQSVHGFSEAEVIEFFDALRHTS